MEMYTCLHNLCCELVIPYTLLPSNVSVGSRHTDPMNNWHVAIVKFIKNNGPWWGQGYRKGDYLEKLMETMFRVLFMLEQQVAYSLIRGESGKEK